MGEPDSEMHERVGSESHGVTSLSSSILRLIALALDLLIAIHALGLGLALIVFVSGVDLGVLSFGRARALSVLAIVIPLRVGLGGRSWLVDLAGRSTNQLAPLWTFARARVRIPAAVVDVAFALITTGVTALFIAFFANLLLIPTRERGIELPFRLKKVVEIFAVWDSGWYYSVASQGYIFSANEQSNIAFFPLYPMLMRALAAPFGGGEKAIWTAGIVVSCTAYALALLALHRLTERVFGDREVARRSVLYLALFPFAFFFTRIYAESVFLLTSVLAVSRALDGRWWRAGMWGALTTLARPNGILIGLPLVLLAVAGRPGLRELARRATPLMLVPAALAGFSGYVYLLSGDPLGWLSSQKHWEYSLGHPPWQQLLGLFTGLVHFRFYDYFFAVPNAPFHLFHGVTGLMFLSLTPAVFRRLGAAMGAYVLVSLLVPLSSNDLVGVGRYAAVLFPIFMLVGSLESPRLHEAILIVASLFLAFFICLFATIHALY